jgi:excisionase family DNA binding protein
MDRAFLSHREAADYLGIAEPTLYRWISNGQAPRGPAPRSVRVGGRRKYRQADLDEWLAQQEQTEDERLAKIHANDG